HGVGRVHAPTRARPGAGLTFNGVNPLGVELAGLVSADGLEDAHDVHVGPVRPRAREDGAAVDEDPGDVEACEAHDAAGHVLVAAADGQPPVVVHAPGDDLDTVGDDLAGDEAVAHPGVAHHDAVGGGGCPVDLRDAAGGADALDGGAGEPVEVG